MTDETQPQFEIRRARRDEIDQVRELIVESMGYWDRTPAYLAQAENLMSLNADDLDRDEACVLTIGSALAAFYRVSVHAGLAEIEEMHIRPRWIGHGYGRAIFEHATRRAADRGAAVLRWSTDGNARGFYERMGGRAVGTEPSGVIGDEPLTVMELAVVPGSRSEST